MNPACDVCKTPSNDNETQSEKLPTLAKDDLERKDEKVKPEEKIRQKADAAEKDQDSLEHDPDQPQAVSSPSKPNMFPINLPSPATTFMIGMLSPIASCAAVYTRDSFSSITGSPSPSAKASPAMTYSGLTSNQLRIPCDKCDRKCVNQKDMEHHIQLWHTDDFPLKNNTFYFQ